MAPVIIILLCIIECNYYQPTYAELILTLTLYTEIHHIYKVIFYFVYKILLCKEGNQRRVTILPDIYSGVKSTISLNVVEIK